MAKLVLKGSEKVLKAVMKRSRALGLEMELVAEKSPKSVEKPKSEPKTEAPKKTEAIQSEEPKKEKKKSFLEKLKS